MTGGFCGDGAVGGPETCDKLAFTNVCDAKMFDYNTFSCTESCTVNKNNGGMCMSCAINTTKYTQVINDLTQTQLLANGAIVPKIMLTDKTLGWLPGVSGVDVLEHRIQKTGDPVDEFAKNPEDPARHFFQAVGPLVQSNKTTTKSLAIAFDGNAACISGNRHYQVNIDNSPDVGSLTSFEQKIFGDFIGGAFDYQIAKKVFTTPTELAADTLIDVKPQGAAGDLRIVFDGPDKSELWLVMENKVGASTSVFPAGNNSYNIRWLGGAGLVGACKPAGLSKFVVTTNYDEREMTAGCVSDGPYAEYDRVFAFDAFGSGKIHEPSSRHILTIRKHNGAFYDASYQVRVVNQSPTRPITPDNKITVYQYDPTNLGQWKNIASFSPSSDIFGMGSVWNAFTFVGSGSIQPGGIENYNQLINNDYKIDNGTLPGG